MFLTVSQLFFTSKSTSSSGDLEYLSHINVLVPETRQSGSPNTSHTFVLHIGFWSVQTWLRTSDWPITLISHQLLPFHASSVWLFYSCLFNLALIILSPALHPVRVKTVQLASRSADTPTNPCLWGLIRLAACLCVCVCVCVCVRFRVREMKGKT